MVALTLMTGCLIVYFPYLVTFEAQKILTDCTVSGQRSEAAERRMRPPSFGSDSQMGLGIGLAFVILIDCWAFELSPT